MREKGRKIMLIMGNHRYDLGKLYLTIYLFAFIFAPPLIPRLNFFHVRKQSVSEQNYKEILFGI